VQRVAIIDYGSGNLHSAHKAFERAAAESGLATGVTLTADPETVRRADRIVLPGVGAFADCSAGLNAVPGMVAALNEAVIQKGRPFLGICVGMQLLATRGLEFGETAGLDWIKGDVCPIGARNVPLASGAARSNGRDKGITPLKIPHMGWNTLNTRHSHPLLADIDTGPSGLHAYFVHSFHFACGNPADLVATVDYGQDVTAMIARNNIVGTQFHPEKSQALGLRLIANFLRWKP
jgi:imidazole glycerol-phosphate synthase subunit HisH